MGKPTGFLDYEREEAKAISPKERIKNFNEFHEPLSVEKQKLHAFSQSAGQTRDVNSGKLFVL